MESKVKLLPFFRFAVHSMLTVVLLAIVAVPLSAGTITVQSDLTNTGASVSSVSDPRLTSGDISGLTFTPVVASIESWTGVPPGAPAGTTVLQIPPGCGTYCGLSGFIETTFTLPAIFSAISLTGAGNVDDWGYVFLNGNLISPQQLTEFGNVGFGTNNAAYFLSGLNTLVISDSNSGGGPSAVAFYANINYSTSVTPEPSTMIMLATGLAGVAGAIRRKLAL